MSLKGLLSWDMAFSSAKTKDKENFSSIFFSIFNIKLTNPNESKLLEVPINVEFFFF